MMKLVTFNIFRRMSKRRRRFALLVAAIDRIEWGPPRDRGRAPELATKVGACRACSTVIDVGDEIMYAHVGPLDGPIATWVHVTCPPWWQIVQDLVENYDELIVVQVIPEGRRTASCGHYVGSAPIYLVRRPVSLDEHNHSYWLCEGCVTR